MNCPIRGQFREAGLVVMKSVRHSYAYNFTDQDLITTFFSF
jgi:hypothetical protein